MKNRNDLPHAPPTRERPEFDPTGRSLGGSTLAPTGRIARCIAGGLTLWAAAVGCAQELDSILLKDYNPVSEYKIPVTRIAQAAFPVIDIHSHSEYATTPEEVRAWVATMDEVGIEKTILLTQATGPAFDKIVALYAEFPTRFELWCGFDYRGYDQPGYGPAAVAELERCVRLGAKGVGEEIDKGAGLVRAPEDDPEREVISRLHMNDPRMDPLLEKCAELGLPISLHVADPIWMYRPMDRHNEGLPNAYLWRLDQKTAYVSHDGMIAILEQTLQRHPRNRFVACHLANLDFDLARLGALFDRHPNLFADLSARFAETATIPRITAAFYAKYSDRILFGSDMGRDPAMYRLHFRILESTDDHFYGREQLKYLWNLYGLGLSQDVLRKLYRDNALRLFGRTPSEGKGQ